MAKGKQGAGLKATPILTIMGQRFTLVLLYCLVATLLPTLADGQDALLVFTQSEEQDSGEFVGSVSKSPLILNMVGESDRADLRYSILSSDNKCSDCFRIGPASGNVTFAKRVDREAVCPQTDVCNMTFSVSIAGSGTFFAQISVRVVITDINDNSPKFHDPPVVNISISETSVTFTQSLATATDADMSPEFGVNSYAIEPPSSVFKVEMTNNSIGTQYVNLVLMQTLDRETQDSYRLLVVAKDGGSPPKSGTLTVNVIVEDVNDNPPIFTPRLYTTNFTEDDGPGYEIVQVSATDKDIGNNGKVVYALSAVQPPDSAGIQEKVSVDSDTGEITLKQPLRSGEYTIFVDAHDLGNPQKSDQCAVKATVLDTVNDAPTVRLNLVPQKNDVPLGWVSEAAPVSTVVGVLDVEDSDSGKNGNVTCECLEPVFQLQQLNAGSYKLMVAKSLDRERNSSYTVKVTCEDQGSPSLNATATEDIKIFDENDNNPVFGTPMYVQKIVENNMKGDTITVVNALDADEGANAEIEYRLANAGNNFTIAPDTGVIKANIVFDREEKSTYDFQVLAVDRGYPRRTGVASVTVNIMDINDVAPKFSKDHYKFSVYENRVPDTIVGNVSVTDPDLGEGGRVSLSLSPINENDVVPFDINDEGRIWTLDRFDREERDSYSFFVLAIDNGSRRLTSSAEVVVQILDVNDNHPTFVFPSDQNFSAYVNIPIKQDEVILQVDVYDEDINQNSIITYSIINSNGSGLFRIGKFSGDIIATRDLGAADIASYFITINATDQGLPLMWESRTLNLIVQSAAASADDVIADQNVLIVVCIVCITIIISGAVLVTMCLVRRHDRQRKLKYAASCCPDNRPDSDNGSMGDGHHQYDLPPDGIKDQTSTLNHGSAYHQQQQQHHHNNLKNSNYKADPSKGFPPDTNNRNVHSSNQAGPSFFPGSHVNPTAESSIQRHDDFHSTSSTETGTGDSGHGSDEDMSNSMEQSITPAMSLEHAIPLDLSGASSGQLRPSVGGSAMPPLQHRVQRPSAMKNPRAKGSNSSVRFDPHVTDIYDQRLSLRNPERPPPLVNRNSSGSSSNISSTGLPPAARRPQSRPFTFQQEQKQQHRPLQQHKGRHPPPVPTSLSAHAGKNSLLMTQLPLPQRQMSLLSQSSIGDDGNDDSDMNTTTSGSYSVASDDVARLSSLADIRDHYV